MTDYSVRVVDLQWWQRLSPDMTRTALSTIQRLEFSFLITELYTLDKIIFKSILNFCSAIQESSPST